MTNAEHINKRTLTVRHPHLTGEDVKDVQRLINNVFESWNWNHRVKVDGDFGAHTRSAFATVLYGLGILHEHMVHGITPALRRKVRERTLTVSERARRARRAAWRRKQRKKYNSRVHTPVNFTTDSWGYHPGVHDGTDLICPEGSPLFAMCDGTIVRADASGWWGLGAPSDAALKSRGDGIIILRATESVGPIKKGMNFCYGHAERATVKAGDHVRAGKVIGHAGFANAGHVHFMVNDNPDTRGVGDRDPAPYYRYAGKN